MRNTLEDLYYGNITPGAQQISPNSELQRATDRVARFESQLTERLGEAERTILAKLIESQEKICQGGISPTVTPPKTVCIIRISSPYR